MDFNTLFTMHDNPDDRGAFYALPVHEGFNAVAIVQGAEDPPLPCRFRRNCGSTPFDVIGSGSAALLLLSPRALQVFRDGGYTGWRSFPVQISGKKGQQIEGYEGLVITGRCGPIDWSRGQFVRKPPPVPRGQGYDAWIGAYFEAATWDGSDFFLPEGTTMCIVTEPVKLACERARITNMQFKCLTQFERSWPI